VWWDALLQAGGDIVVKNRGNNYQKVRINGDTKHCLLVDMKAFWTWSGWID